MKRYKAQILPSAYRDIQDASTWYKQHSIELPGKVVQQVKITVEKIRQAPFAYAIRYKEIRIANVRVFPYAVHYFLEDNKVLIIGIHHTSISPQKWIIRI